MNTDAVIATTLAYGVEGVHFTRNADGTLTRTEKGLQEIGAWARGVGNYMDLVPALDVMGATFKDDFKAENSLAVPTAFVGFTFDPAPVETEIAALKNVYAEYNYRIASGSGNAALLEEYIKKLNDNQLQKVLDEINRQIEVFYVNKAG
jgi:putative aldouronate transport system substrate-binding protein